MAKRFTDTNKYKKPFIRGLQGAYKLLWDFLYHDCDHAGIWIVDFETAQIYIGKDMPVTKEKAVEFFNQDEKRIIELEGGKKWFIPSFIEFQYGQLSANNRAHINIISVLKKNNLLDNELSLIKGLISPLQGAKEQYKEMEQEQVKGVKGENKVADLFDDFEADVLTLTQAKEAFCMQNKITVARYDELAKEFINERRIVGMAGWLGKPETKSHMVNWMRRRFQDKNTGKQKQTSGGGTVKNFDLTNPLNKA